MKPLILGIATTEISAEEMRLFQQYKPLGFILFSRNIESKTQIANLTKSLKDLYPERDVPIFIDQEGGRVARIKPPIAQTTYKSAEYFSMLYAIDKKAAKTALETNYEMITTELKTMGIDSPCAPVCDIYYKNASEVISDRSFGSDADNVIDLCKSAIKSILSSGSIPFIKHIPGHGRAKTDSHYDLPIIDTPLEELEQTDFKVFAALAKENVWAMTAHIIYTSIDPTRAATISPIVISYIRDKIGFKGKLVSDDICMYALHGKIGQTHSTLKQLIKLAKTDNHWQQEYIEKFKLLFKLDINTIDNNSIIDLCNEKLVKIKPEFLASLQEITKMSIAAGCDIVMHCSGDIDEMQSVCSSI